MTDDGQYGPEDWQPIGTMPRDGTPVLVYMSFSGDPVGIVLAHWEDDARGFNIVPVNDGSPWHIRGAWAWRPLPEPPLFPQPKVKQDPKVIDELEADKRVGAYVDEIIDRDHDCTFPDCDCDCTNSFGSFCPRKFRK